MLMKKSVAFFLFFFFFWSSLPLFAQNFRQARIFVPQVTGDAPAQERAFFHQKLTYEVILQYFEAARSRNNCEFILSGAVIPLEQFMEVQGDRADSRRASLAGPVPHMPIPSVRNSGSRREFFSWDIDDSAHFFDTTGEDNYEPRSSEPDSTRSRREPVGDKVFTIELINKATREIVAHGHIVYEETDVAVNDELGIILYEMLSVVPEIEEVTDFRSQWLFIETSVLWTPRMYSNEGNSLHLANFGFRAALDFQLLGFLTLSIGAQVTEDWIVVSNASGSTDEYRDLILEVPLSLKLTLKPGDNLMLELYGGASWNFSLWETTEPHEYSWFAGIQLGFRAGPGMIVIDPRFSQDFQSSQAGTLEYQRHMVQIGIGYKFGLFPKRRVREY